MKIIREEPFEKIVHAWLRAEWAKHGYDKQFTELQGLVDHPDFDSADDNAARLRLLSARRAPILQWIPSSTRWYSTIYDADDVVRTYIIPSEDWLPISSDSYYMPTTLANVDSSHRHASWIREIYDTLPNQDLDTKVIAVATSLGSPITIIEGNHRAVALLKYHELHPEQALLTEIYIGLSDNMHNNNWHIESPRTRHLVKNLN